MSTTEPIVSLESDPIAITDTMISVMSGLFDPQDHHLSAETAESSIFGEQTASSALSFSLLVRAFVSLPIARRTPLVLARIESMVWNRPIYADDRVRLVASLAELNALEGARSRYAEVVLDVVLLNQDAATVLEGRLVGIAKKASLQATVDELCAAQAG